MGLLKINQNRLNWYQWFIQRFDTIKDECIPKNVNDGFLTSIIGRNRGINLTPRFIHNLGQKTIHEYWEIDDIMTK